MKLQLRVVGTVLAALIGATAQADPIIYEADIVIDAPFLAGVIDQENNSSEIPVDAEYYSFHANAGELLSITVLRTDRGYDPAFWVFEGLFADTDDFGPEFDTKFSSFVAFGDDEIDHPGPFGDPRVLMLVPATDSYTIAVVNFSSSGSPPFHFTIGIEAIREIVPVPEPSAIASLMFGMSGLVVLRRKKLREILA